MTVGKVKQMGLSLFGEVMELVSPSSEYRVKEGWCAADTGPRGDGGVDGCRRICGWQP